VARDELFTFGDEDLRDPEEAWIAAAPAPPGPVVTSPARTDFIDLRGPEEEAPAHRGGLAKRSLAKGWRPPLTGRQAAFACLALALLVLIKVGMAAVGGGAGDRQVVDDVAGVEPVVVSTRRGPVASRAERSSGAQHQRVKRGRVVARPRGQRRRSSRSHRPRHRREQPRESHRRAATSSSGGSTEGASTAATSTGAPAPTPAVEAPVEEVEAPAPASGSGGVASPDPVTATSPEVAAPTDAAQSQFGVESGSAGVGG